MRSTYGSGEFGSGWIWINICMKVVKWTSNDKCYLKLKMCCCIHGQFISCLLLYKSGRPYISHLPNPKEKLNLTIRSQKLIKCDIMCVLWEQKLYRRVWIKKNYVDSG